MKSSLLNCGGNHFGRDCTKPAKKDDEKKEKVNVIFRGSDEDYEVNFTYPFCRHFSE